jgi:hypothetical protein
LHAPTFSSSPQLHLPFVVDSDKGGAKWNALKKTLDVTLPVVEDSGYGEMM